MYHEKQVKELCALHSLNNIFQDSNAFTKSKLDEICISLAPEHWLNPHKSILGTGNYDINVIMAALSIKECAMIWFDKRKDPDLIVPENVIGFILNVPSEYKIGPVQLPVKRKHWIAIKNFDGLYFNLDSKLEEPKIIGNESELKKYLRDELHDKEKELFIVVSQEVECNRSWSNECHLESVVNGEEDSAPFTAVGLKYIDQDHGSMGSSVDSLIERSSNGFRS